MSAEDLEAAVVEASSPFAYRDFRLAQGARFLSTIAIQMQSVAVGWQVYALTHKPMDLGYVGLAQFMPAFVLSLAAGHVADRFDRRNVVAICQVGFALTALALLALARPGGVGGVGGVLPIYAVLVFFGVARAFAGPATQALMPNLVPPSQLAKAIAWSSSVWEIAAISGPAAGGIVYGATGSASAVYGVSAAFMITSVGLTLAIRTKTNRGTPRGVDVAHLLAGVRYVWEKKIVLGAISLDLFAVLFGGAVALLPAYAQDVLHVGPWGLGILRSGPAAGALTMAVLLANRPITRRAGVLMLGCVGLFGVATVVFGMSRSFGLSFAALVVVGASDMVSVVVRQTLIQVATPEAMRGRVSAVNLVFIGASNELGEFESGFTAAWLGLVPAVVLGGLGTILVVGAWALAFPALRRVDSLTALALEPPAGPPAL